MRPLPLRSCSQSIACLKQGRKKRFPIDISKEALKKVRPLLESVRKQTKPRTVDLYEVFCGVQYFLKSGPMADVTRVNFLEKYLDQRKLLG